MNRFFMTMIGFLATLNSGFAQQSNNDSPIQPVGFLNLPGEIVSRPYLLSNKSLIGSDACNSNCAPNLCETAACPKARCRTGWDWTGLRAWLTYKAAPACSDNRPTATGYRPPLYTYFRFPEEQLNMQAPANCASNTCVSNYAPLVNAIPSAAMLPSVARAPVSVPMQAVAHQPMNSAAIGYMPGQTPASILPDRPRYTMNAYSNPMPQQTVNPMAIPQPVMARIPVQPVAVAPISTANVIPGFQLLGGPNATDTKMIQAGYRK